MVGRLARMRVSSVMRTFLPRISVGTLKSTRTRTRLPRTSRSRSASFDILLVLLLVIVIVLDEICCFVLPQHVSPLRKLAKQSNEHLHNSRKLFLLSGDLLLAGEFSHAQNIQTSRAFQRRAARHFQKPRAISR